MLASSYKVSEQPVCLNLMLLNHTEIYYYITAFNG